ncbi:MAG: glycosyltransferase family 39 protein, partial [Ktedonobacterales bacterium]
MHATDVFVRAAHTAGEAAGRWPGETMRNQEVEDGPAMAAMRQEDVPAAEQADDVIASDGNWRRWCWLRHWEFWLALALGAFLRLWQIGTTQFLDDQAGLYALARTSVLHGAFPLTGIPSSIGTLNPPLSVYLLLPFAALTANPLPAVVTLALWNVAGVVFCYIFALRYFGRRVAAVGTLLFATNAAALNYSRFLWQQNYLPPLLALWALTLYMGAVRGKRRWLAGNILLLCLAILLHATAALLAPITLAGILLAPRFPRLRAYVVAAAGVLLLMVPTLIFEVASRGYDLRKLAHYALHGGHFDGQIFSVFVGALSGAGSGDLGPQAPYAASAAWFPIFPWVTLALVLAGWLVLTVRIGAPAVALWRGAASASGDASKVTRVKRWGVAVWRGLRTDAVWRGRFLLWFWVTLPPLTMLHHSGDLFVHYLLVIFPAVFIVGGFGVEWVLRAAATLPARAVLLRRAAPALALLVVALVVAG